MSEREFRKRLRRIKHDLMRRALEQAVARTRIALAIAMPTRNTQREAPVRSA